MKQWQIFLMAALFLAVFSSFENAEAPASPISLSSDISSADIMVDDGTDSYFVEAELTLSNADTRYRHMEAHMIAVWPSGVAWSTHFVDKNYDELANNTVEIDKGGDTVVKFIVFCEDVCTPGDTNTVQIYALSDPVWYPNRNDTSDENNTSNETSNTCGSDDCETDTSPASASSNFTNTITISLIARTAYDFDIACDAVSSEGGNEVSQGNTTLWDYTLTNTGWNTDNYQFTSTVASADGHDVGYWTLSPGMADGKEITGQGDAAPSAVHIAAGSISIIPATNATPGIYNVELTVTSNNGAPDSGCDFDVVVPGSETEEETTADPANETAEEPIGTGEACTGCSAECCEFCADTDGECPYDCVYNEDQSDNPSSCLAPGDEEPREFLPSISLISAIAVIGSIVIFRRK